MYCKIVWCYLIVLDISLNTKLSAQGKSHGNGVSVHESLMEGISLQEWGTDSGASVATRGGAAPPGAVELAPPALDFGRAALAAAHARAVTLTNTGNETIHLASVAGTSPDFHASFFEAKTLEPLGNTTFSVVYVGRREGPVATHLFIHTSRGVLKYPVSAVGVASAWRVWPLVGVRVPLNATLEPLLTLYNPTDATVQVSEVYSSGSWVGLRLPAGGESAPRALWTLPPRAARPLVRLRLRPPPPHRPPRTAYIRIKGNMTGGGLVVAVEAGGAPPGEFLSPLQLRLRARGSRDPPDTLTLEAGNSEEAPVKLDAEVWGARCAAAPPDPPPPPPPAPAHANGGRATEAGVGAGAGAGAGARVTLLRDSLDARHELAPAAQLTLDYAALWAEAGAAGVGAEGAWCAGWVRVGRAAAPYSVRVLRGTLALTPDALHFVTAAREAALRMREVRAHNEFPVPVHVEHVHFPPEILQHFHTESLAPLVLASGGSETVARLRLRTADGDVTFRALVTLRTNLTDYTLPVLLYEGRLHFEWEWPLAGADGSLDLGAVGAGSTLRVAARLRNRGAAALCATGARALLAGAALELAGPRCAAPGGSVRAVLAVAAPARAGAAAGLCRVTTPHAATDAPLALRAHAGRLAARPLLLDGVAPYVWARAPLVLESSMALRMRVTQVAQPPAAAPDPALSYRFPAEEAARWVGWGRTEVGAAVYAAEAACEPRCSTGLDPAGAEGAAWVARGALPAAAAAHADAALRAQRRAAFPRATADLALLVHTTQVLAVEAAAAVRWAWPALTAPAGAGAAPPLAPVGGAAPLRVRVRNPAARPLLVQARLADAAGAFSLGEWRAVSGAAAAWAAPAPAGDYVLLQPAAEIEYTVTFAPTHAAELSTVLYLRNNLTILEDVPLTGRGVYPSFELAGRKPNSTSPILLEAAECGAGGAGTVRRTVVVRNTGAVGVRLREWRVGGAPCLARGFRLQPCGALALAPNESRALTLAFTPDWTRARAAAALSVRAAPAAGAGAAGGAARAEFALAGAAPARLIARCAPRAPRPPFEPALRALGHALALLALALAVALAAADAERALRRQRRAPPAAPAAPLDLRALALARPDPPPPAPAPRAAPPAPPRRRRAPRAPHHAAAERRAFERWRAEVSRGGAPPDEESRSSEEGETAAPPPRGDASSSSPDSSPAPRERYGAAPATPQPAPAPRGYPPPRRARSDGASTSRSDSSPSHSERSHSERSEPEHSPVRAPPPAPRAPGSPAPGEAPPPDSHTPPDHSHTTGTSSRHESSSSRAAERSRGSGGGGGGGAGAGAGGGGAARERGSARAGGRKERAAWRRARGASPPAAARGSPPRAEGRAAGGVRWGASWSSVVSRGAAPPPPPPPPPLAPIGSDVRRRAGSHSLFYYGAAPHRDPDPEPVWPERAPPPHRDYLGAAGALPDAAAPLRARAAAVPAPAGGYRSLESVWGASVEPHPAAAAWLWGGAGAGAGAGVRPPPGFGGARAVRSYDPFHSLASIWTPAALDWRRHERADRPACSGAGSEAGGGSPGAGGAGGAGLPSDD